MTTRRRTRAVCNRNDPNIVADRFSCKSILLFDAIAFVIGTEVYDHLEAVMDRFEDVANEISAIVIENV